MKVKVKTQEEFQPIEITITIESESELCDLYHRVNCSIEKIEQGSITNLKFGPQYCELFETISKLVNRHKLFV